MRIQLDHKFEDIIGVENLLEAWREFVRGKREKRDVQVFSLRLMDNILKLHDDLRQHTYLGILSHGNTFKLKTYVARNTQF